MSQARHAAAPCHREGWRWIRLQRTNRIYFRLFLLLWLLRFFSPLPSLPSKRFLSMYLGIEAAEINGGRANNTHDSSEWQSACAHLLTWIPFSSKIKNKTKKSDTDFSAKEGKKIILVNIPHRRIRPLAYECKNLERLIETTVLTMAQQSNLVKKGK